MPTRVINIRTGDTWDIYIGRRLRDTEDWGFGNPFRSGTHVENINMFGWWLMTGDAMGCEDATEERRKWMLENIKMLRGKRLACWCKPDPCHGDVLARMAEED